MKAMVLQAPGQALRWMDAPAPAAAPGQVLLRVAACAVCRSTDLHVIDGELPDPELRGAVHALGRTTGLRAGPAPP